MIYKNFKFPADQITGFLYSRIAKIFTVRLKDNSVVHYQPEYPEVFLKWLEDNAPVAEVS